MEKISYDEFKKVDLRVAKILVAERIEGSDKLLRLEVSVGEDPSTGSGQARQIIAGIGKVYPPETLVGREIIIVANLEPRKLMGLESQGMLLAADDNGSPTLLTPFGEVPPGSIVK
ncbi:methionine--tRNA ligase subunit beta [Candidatus Giovannonibacteria bacterium RIFCSPLOWO2_01_FULL_46_13]|uniref:Methionine--tRNA ligase n=1 Tax=Candidatus Giovannonibacteria bacterium RIFCSPLOWO2_01_FULL_46_13 TaxID=1798352 RepID=A0A1F5X4T9_9BACT|nr:MAG: methionine--tRNA ligase subunit beta [Candidatus Giovannonibacteria bacterium RIFCSPLOWO2_01_FULL_46_13]